MADHPLRAGGHAAAVLERGARRLYRGTEYGGSATKPWDLDGGAGQLVEEERVAIVRLLGETRRLWPRRRDGSCAICSCRGACWPGCAGP